jgi:hypothetical protein
MSSIPYFLMKTISLYRLVKPNQSDCPVASHISRHAYPDSDSDSTRLAQLRLSPPFRSSPRPDPEIQSIKAETIRCHQHPNQHQSSYPRYLPAIAICAPWRRGSLGFSWFQSMHNFHSWFVHAVRLDINTNSSLCPASRRA